MLTKKIIIKNNSGMTLVEMILAVTITAVLIGIIAVIVIQAFYVNRYSIEQGINLASLQNTLRNFSTNVREAKQSDSGSYMIVAADDFEFTFYSNIDDDDATERLHYYLEGSQLKLGVSEGSGFPVAYPENDQEVRDVGFGIVNTAEQPVFYYFGSDYPIASEDPLETPVSPEEITLVKIGVYANVNTDHVPDSMYMETFVRPRNID